MLSFGSNYALELPSQRTIEVQRILASISCVALILVTTTFSFGATRPTAPTISEVSGIYFTHFTPNSIMTFDVFVGLMFLGQVNFITRLLATKNEALLISATRGVSYHFILFNLMQMAQIVLWCFQKFVLTELILILNIVNLSLLGLRLGPSPHKTTFLKNLVIQIPLVKMPLGLEWM